MSHIKEDSMPAFLAMDVWLSKEMSQCKGREERPWRYAQVKPLNGVLPQNLICFSGQCKEQGARVEPLR